MACSGTALLLLYNTSYMSEIASEIRTVAVFVNVSRQIMYSTEMLGAFIACPHAKFQRLPPMVHQLSPRN
jgi:hypothetical protein